MTDPAGKLKKFTTDIFGNLTSVTEPDPLETTVSTTHTYDLLNHLINTVMTRRKPDLTGYVTQTRSFNYDMTTQRLMSASNPENGTVSYTYNSDGTIATKGQKVVYTYNDDLGRPTQIDRYPDGVTADVCQTVMLTYDSAVIGGGVADYLLGRLSGATTGTSLCTQQITEAYNYMLSGQVFQKEVKLRLYASVGALDTFYYYDNEGRLTDEYVPVPTVSTQGLWKQMHYTYDNMAHLASVVDENIPSTPLVSNAQYGPANELKQLTYWNAANSTYATESRTYNARLQLTDISIPGVAHMRYAFVGSTDTAFVNPACTQQALTQKQWAGCMRPRGRVGGRGGVSVRRAEALDFGYGGQQLGPSRSARARQCSDGAPTPPAKSGSPGCTRHRTTSDRSPPETASTLGRLTVTTAPTLFSSAPSSTSKLFHHPNYRTRPAPGVE